MNFITSLAVAVVKICLVAATGCVYAGDAITLFITKGFRATTISRRAQYWGPKSKRTGLSMLRNSRPSSIGAPCPTNQSQYHHRFSQTAHAEEAIHGRE